MRGQQFAGFFHSMNDAFGEFGFAEIIRHGFCQFPPEFIAAFFMDALVTNHGKLVCSRQQVCADQTQSIKYGTEKHTAAENKVETNALRWTTPLE